MTSLRLANCHLQYSPQGLQMRYYRFWKRSIRRWLWWGACCVGLLWALYCIQSERRWIFVCGLAFGVFWLSALLRQSWQIYHLYYPSVYWDWQRQTLAIRNFWWQWEHIPLAEVRNLRLQGEWDVPSLLQLSGGWPPSYGIVFWVENRYFRKYFLFKLYDWEHYNRPRYTEQTEKQAKMLLQILEHEINQYRQQPKLAQT